MSTPSTARQGHVAALQWGLVQAALVAVVGAYGGYTWVTGGYARTTHEAHRTRLRFVVALVGLWVAHVPVELGLLVAVDSALVRALAPPVLTLLLLVGAFLLAYRVDPSVFGRVQRRLASTGQRTDAE